MKLVVNCQTGEQVFVPFNDEEREEHEQRASNAMPEIESASVPDSSELLERLAQLEALVQKLATAKTTKAKTVVAASEASA